jgi:hypothetical protein
MIQIAGEHAPELEFVDTGRDGFHVLEHRGDHGLVIFHFRQFQIFQRLIETIKRSTDLGDCFIQRGAFLAQCLSSVRIIPDLWVFQFAVYFFEPFDFVIEVKDTP